MSRLDMILPSIEILHVARITKAIVNDKEIPLCASCEPTRKVYPQKYDSMSVGLLRYIRCKDGCKRRWSALQ